MRHKVIAKHNVQRSTVPKCRQILLMAPVWYETTRCNIHLKLQVFMPCNKFVDVRLSFNLTIDSFSSSRLKPKWLNENRQTNHKIILFSFGGLRGNAVIFKRPTSIPIYIYMTKFIMPKVWWYISKWNYSIFRLWKIGSDVAEYTWSSFKIRSKPKSVPIYGHIFYTK